MRIIEYPTHFYIQGASDAQALCLLQNLYTVDYHSGEEVPYGFFHYPAQELYRIPRGVGRDEIIRSLKYNSIEKGNHFKTVNKLDMQLKNDPLNDKQRAVLTKAKDIISKKPQIIINMPTGEGKTYTAINVIQSLGKRPMIFVYSDNLKKQWIDAFLQHTNIKHSQIFEISGMQSVWTAKDHGHDYEVFIASHRTLQEYVLNHGFKALNELFIHTDIGVKVFDECDYEVDNMLRIDCHTAVEKTIYLTATMYKSSKFDDKVFQYLFKDVDKVGDLEYKDVIGNREGIMVFYKSKPTKSEFMKCHKIKLAKGKYNNTESRGGTMLEFRSEAYHKYMVHSLSFLEPLGYVADIIRRSITKDPKGKHFLFVGLKESCSVVADLLVKKFGYDKDEVGIYHSDISAEGKAVALRKPIVVSISRSLGRGVDIKGIKIVADFEAYTSKPMFKQAVGRCGRKGGDTGLYIKVFDNSFKTFSLAYEKFSREFKKEFMDVKYKNIKGDD